METEYRRDLNHTYLIVKEEEENPDSYENRMLLACRIPGLLACSTCHINNEVYLRYDITSRRTAKEALEEAELTQKELQWLLGKLLLTVDQIEEYLLPSEHLVLDPKMVFLNLAEQNIWLLYVPCYERDFKMSLREFMDFLLPKLDRTDETAIMTGYRFYRRVLENDSTLASLIESLEAINGKTGQGYQDAKAVGDGFDFAESEDDERSDDPFRETSYHETGSQDTPYGNDYSGVKDSDTNKRKSLTPRLSVSGHTLILVAVLLAAALSACAFLHPEIFADMDIETAAGCAILAVICGIGVGLYLKKHKKAQEQKVPVYDREEERLDFYGEEKNSSGKIKRRKLEGGGDEDFHFNPGQRIDWNNEENPGFDTDSHVFNEDDERTVLLNEDDSSGSNRPCLVPEVPASGLQRIDLQNATGVIGKLKDSADYIITNPAVSRVHAKIRCIGGSFFLSDCNSRNGTKVNKEPLYGDAEVELREGDYIQFADSGFIFKKRIPGQRRES